ncbi:DUF6777 domain-containing protein [Streptomyces sp. NPDC006285]|uniref:DUF6777 domain-containing protein n=1 Tax=Streptomyces sp. NPDC006285 TaxID=3364742 RepID=UPI003697B821
MSVEPPSSGRPTGPPSGPLSGPSGPSGSSVGGSGGPGLPGGPGESGPGADGKGPGRPWWKSVPRVAVIAAVVVVAVVLAVVLTRPDDDTTTATGSDGEVFLQTAGSSGPDPFTASTARDSSTAPMTPSPTDTSESPEVTRGVDGSAPGLYGGSRETASCDVEKQISELGRSPAKNEAFAAVLGLRPSSVPAQLRALTPVRLRMDTRVTNHGFRDGKATAYQAVLQSGTAVLVDDRGVPRVRCACGNPLLPPVALKTRPRTTGEPWPSYRPSNVVVVSPAPRPVERFVLHDESGDWFTRHKGDTGGKDRRTEPPASRPSPSTSSLPPSSASPPCASAPGAVADPCPSTSSDTPSPPSPESGSPSSEPPPASSAPDDAPAPGDASDTTTQSAAGHRLQGRYAGSGAVHAGDRS